MKLQKSGKRTSGAEILNVSKFGIWMLIEDREYFLSYKDFPWFQKASVENIYSFEFLHKRHLYWPSLDIDLSLESLQSPSMFPLIAKNRSD